MFTQQSLQRELSQRCYDDVW